MPVLEAGVEEALAHLHTDSNNPTANGWSSTNVAGATGYWRTRTNSDGSYFFTTVYNYTSNNPIIYSAGFVPSPMASGYISRLVRVLASNSPTTFGAAIAANGQISLSGGAGADGYDSSKGPYSTVSNRTANGKVVTNGKSSKTISISSGHIYGSAVTGPGGTVYASGSGTIGDASWNASSTGIQPGSTNNNMNVAFPSNSPPSGPYLPVITTSINSSNIIFLSSATYQTTDVTGISDKTKPMIVTGNAVLWITGDLTVSGSGYIYLMPGASLKLYVAGTATVSGGGVVNGTGVPANFSYIGLSSNTSLTYSGSADFVGTINAPQADLTVSGGASVYGAVLVNSANISGGAGVHYDTALGGTPGLVVIGWAEL